ncbi:hypothetical protein [uncultured Microbacterium sp.]|uniref:hypothetical protein n=1 Tax=uncultured Microbacterium sp. TaxID=191216 RepID=UPI0035CB9E3A
MVIEAKPLTRVWMLALAGFCVAFAWVLLTLTLGWGSGGAHAADDDRGGLLGGVTDTLTGAVDNTLDTVAGTATATVSEVVSTAVSTVTTVVPPAAPVVDAAVPVVQAVTDTVGAVAEPVTDIASSGVVGTVADPLVSTVESVPVVGDVASALGVGHAAHAVARTVDHTLGTTTGALGTIVGSTPGTISGAVPPHGGLPGLPWVSGADALLPALTSHSSPASAPVLRALAVPGLVAATLLTSMGDAAASVVSSVSASFSALATAGGAGALSALLVGLCAPAGVFSSGSASGPGAAALVARGPLAAHRAWVRRHGPTNDRVPPAPIASTDVSPD